MSNLDTFLFQNAPFLTVPDLAEETGLSQNDIRKRCLALKITPIKLKDQVQQFVVRLGRIKAPEEIARRCGVRLDYLRPIYAELNIPFAKPLPKVEETPPIERFIQKKQTSGEKTVTPREILADFQVGTHHYHFYGSRF